MPNPVTHFEVLGRDAEALRAFYADVFGWTVGSPAGGYSMMTPDEQAGISGGHRRRARRHRRSRDLLHRGR